MNRQRWGLSVMALGLVLVAVSAAALFLPRSVAEPTSFSPAPQGVKAFYLLLGRLGYRPVRWERPWRRLPQVGRLLVYQPYSPLSSGEETSLLAWVRSGHLAWVETNNRGLVQELLGAKLTAVSQPSAYAHPLRRDALTAGVKVVLPATSWRIVPGGTGVGEVGDEGGWVLASRNLGRGRLVVSTGYLLANAGLARGDNLRLALNVLERGPVLFDEYHHGYAMVPVSRKAASGGDIPPVAWLAIIQSGVALILALYWAGARLGPPVAPTSSAPLWAGEYALAQARLFRRARARRYILRELLNGQKGQVDPSLTAKVTQRLQPGGKAINENEFLALAEEIVEGG